MIVRRFLIMADWMSRATRAGLPFRASSAHAKGIRLDRRPVFEVGEKCIDSAGLAGDPLQRRVDVGEEPRRVRRAGMPTLQLGDGEQGDGELHADRHQFLMLCAIHRVLLSCGARRIDAIP